MEPSETDAIGCPIKIASRFRILALRFLLTGCVDFRNLNYLCAPFGQTVAIAQLVRALIVVQGSWVQIRPPINPRFGGGFCASRLRLGGAAWPKFCPHARVGKQRPAAFPGFDSGVSILRNLDEVARPVLWISGIKELGPGNAALDQRHAALVGLDVGEGRAVNPSCFAARMLAHGFTTRCKHPQRGEAIFNGGQGQRHWSFQPMEESKSFISSANGMQRVWPVFFRCRHLRSGFLV